MPYKSPEIKSSGRYTFGEATKHRKKIDNAIERERTANQPLSKRVLSKLPKAAKTVGLISAGVPTALTVGTAAVVGNVVSTHAKYMKDYQKTGNIPFDRFQDVLEAGDFAINSYYPNKEISGWDYIWIEDHGVDAAFFAMETHRGNVTRLVFSFRGTVDFTDALTDANASHAQTITEWTDRFKLDIPITGASGFINRIVSLGNNGLADVVEGIITAYNQFEELGKFNVFKRDVEEFRRQFEEEKRKDSENKTVTGWGFGDDSADDNDNFEIERLKNEGSMRGQQSVSGIDTKNFNLKGDMVIEEIIVTGHSLGGAVADLFATILCEILPEELAYRIKLITFEPARALRKSTVDQLKANNGAFDHMLRNAIFTATWNDPVPLVPEQGYLEIGPRGFTHIGTNWYIPNSALPTLKARTVYGLAHGSEGIVESLKKTYDDYMSTRDEPAMNARVYVTKGSGKAMMKMRRNKSKSSRMMKAKMAYVRSFKKH